LLLERLDPLFGIAAELKRKVLWVGNVVEFVLATPHATVKYILIIINTATPVHEQTYKR
jgi:hypothetical protein